MSSTCDGWSGAWAVRGGELMANFIFCFVSGAFTAVGSGEEAPANAGRVILDFS